MEDYENNKRILEELKSEDFNEYFKLTNQYVYVLTKVNKKLLKTTKQNELIYILNLILWYVFSVGLEIDDSDDKFITDTLHMVINNNNLISSNLNKNKLLLLKLIIKDRYDLIFELFDDLSNINNIIEYQKTYFNDLTNIMVAFLNSYFIPIIPRRTPSLIDINNELINIKKRYKSINLK